jgi:plasmid maintenance system antidote protein VapI
MYRLNPEMAVWLWIAFGTTAESWLAQQIQFDLSLAERSRKKLGVKRIAA